MKAIVFGVVISAVVSGGAFAQTDKLVSNAAIANHIAGKQFWLPGGVASFARNGAYSFGGLFTGKWRVTQRSICIAFDSGARRCDKVVGNGKELVLVDSSGTRTLLK